MLFNDYFDVYSITKAKFGHNLEHLLNKDWKKINIYFYNYYINNYKYFVDNGRAIVL